MNAEVGIEEERLPVIYRTIKLPEELWENVKNRAKQEQKAIRWIIDEALDSETRALPLSYVGDYLKCYSKVSLWSRHFCIYAYLGTL